MTTFAIDPQTKANLLERIGYVFEDDREYVLKNGAKIKKILWDGVESQFGILVTLTRSMRNTTLREGLDETPTL